MPVLTVKKPLRDKLGDEAVDSLIEIINEALANQKNDVLRFVEEKFERRLSEEVKDIRAEIANVRADLIKWMFIFWVGQVAVIMGLLFAFFK